MNFSSYIKKGGEKNEDDDCIVLTSKNVILRLLSKDPNKGRKTCLL